MPINLDELSGVEGLGPKKISILYKVLGIKNLKELENAAKKHKIASLSGFGEKTEKNILEGDRIFKRSSGRFLLGEILPKVRAIMAELTNLKEVEAISEAGSLRRRKETIGDADILAISSKPQAVINCFVSLPGVIKIWEQGDN